MVLKTGQPSEDVLFHQAYHDVLTGLPNRILFEYHLHEALKRAHKSKALVAVVAFDLDSLKNVNHN